MSITRGITFLYRFSVGEYDLNNPGVNILSVTSTALGDHSKTNLTTTPLRETWRSLDVSVAQEIIIRANDLTDSIDTFAVLNHNFSPDAVVILQANIANNFTSPPLTIQIPWNETHMVILQDLGFTYEYFKLTILDPTNPCGYVEIGKIVGGKAFAFHNNEDMEESFSINADDLSYKMKSEGFFRASNERVHVDKMNLTFNGLKTLPADGNDNYLGLKEMIREVGEIFPFLTIIDPSDPYFQITWGLFDNLPSKAFRVNRYINMSMVIQEVF